MTNDEIMIKYKILDIVASLKLRRLNGLGMQKEWMFREWLRGLWKENWQEVEGEIDPYLDGSMV